MANNKPNAQVVAALAGVLVGTLIGVGTLQYAQLVASKGADPNDAAESTIHNDRFVREIPVLRDINREVENPTMVPPRRAENAEVTNEHAAAPAELQKDECSGISFGSRRWVKCWFNDLYELNEMPR
ncbi:MAG: hypothetical protein V1926_02440 [Candidatus Peregrinibacteria bacterium]